MRKCRAILCVLTVSCHSEQREEFRKSLMQGSSRDTSSATLCQDDTYALIVASMFLYRTHVILLSILFRFFRVKAAFLKQTALIF